MLKESPERMVKAIEELIKNTDQITQDLKDGKITEEQAFDLGLNLAVEQVADKLIRIGETIKTGAGVIFTDNDVYEGIYGKGTGDIVYGAALAGAIVAAVPKKHTKDNFENEGIYDLEEAREYLETKYGAKNILSIKIDEVTGRTIIETTGGQKGGWNKTLNKDLDPNTDYKVGDAIYKTDANGRVNELDTELTLNKADRNGHQQTKSAETNGIKDAQADDHGGHLIASMLDGLGEQINYVPMNKNVNGSGGAWYNLEQEFKRELINGSNVKVNIQPQYTGNSKRPDSFEVVYWVDGKQKKRYINN